MATTDHERIARKVLDAWNSQDVERLVACYTPSASESSTTRTLIGIMVRSGLRSPLSNPSSGILVSTVRSVNENCASAPQFLLQSGATLESYRQSFLDLPSNVPIVLPS